jgi:16S rRNA (guanine527-N7)-methyltransferase
VTFHVKPSAADQAALALTPVLQAKLDRYAALVLEWNRRINLVGPMEAGAFRSRHLADSLQLLPLLPADGPLADLGSGAGLPGLVLAMGRVLPTHLVEADRRKAAFLQYACAELGLRHVTVHAARIEQVALGGIGVVTARGLAPLGVLLSYAARLLAPDGIALFHKGRGVDTELAAAAAHWHFDVERVPSRTAPDATILRISRLRRAQG